MSRIRILPEAVANRIAAGEVVERPASVVKELLENALDAGAKTIRVEVEAGGKRMIRVIDDGYGMSHDDALLAFERHATSKLRSADDLLSIPTLGFRGEALPTIAAVSRLLLETRAEEDAEGTRVEFAGGKLVNVKPAGLPVGTTVSADHTVMTQGAVPFVSNVTATLRSPTSAVLSAAVDPRAVATQWYFEYGPTTSYGSELPVTPGDAGSGIARIADLAVDAWSACGTGIAGLTCRTHQGGTLGARITKASLREIDKRSKVIDEADIRQAWNWNPLHIIIRAIHIIALLLMTVHGP